MTTSVTVGFAVEEVDRARLDHLADVFGAGSRSNFLRAAMTVMEQVEQVGRLERVRAYGATRLAAAGYTVEDIPDIVEHALREPDLEAAAQAALVRAAIHRRRAAVVQDSASCDDQLDALSATESVAAMTAAALDVLSLVAGVSQPGDVAALQSVPDDVLYQVVLVLAGRELGWRIDEVERALDSIQQLPLA